MADLFMSVIQRHLNKVEKALSPAPVFGFYYSCISATNYMKIMLASGTKEEYFI
jgi:hypothetical protein